MKFSLSRRLQKIVLPVSLLVMLCAFGVYDLYVSSVPMYGDILVGDRFLKAQPELTAAGMVGFSAWLSQMYYYLGCAHLVVFLATGILGLRRPFIQRLYMLMAAAQVLITLPALYLYVKIPSVLLTAPGISKVYRSDEQAELLLENSWLIGLVLLVLISWIVLLTTRAVRCVYWRTYDTDADWGDRVLEDLRSNGRQPGMRRSSYISLALHVLVLFIIPWLLGIGGCVEPYHLPQGSGTPQVMEVMKVQKKKKKKRIVLNMNSAIIFHKPEIDESKVFEELEEVTQETYKANNQAGKLGVGGGKKGGWPDGAENARIRFIRLKVSGSMDWDQDMGDGADYNFLIKFGEYTGFKIADTTESVSITEIRRFPKGKAPPFIYITGGHGSISISAREKKILREYLIEEGGMLFADAGGSGFDRPFKAMMAQVLPEYNFVTLSDDDPVFQSPYMFSEGAHPFWAHANGGKSQGIKHNGRLVVYYHPGDINDAWKTGHSGASEAVATQAYKLGVNVVYYSFVNYYRQHYGE